MHILYWAEDRTDERLRKALAELRHIVEPARSLEDAEAMARFGGWDVVLCDLGRAGRDAVPALRAAAPDAWLVVVGPSELEPARVGLLRAGADAVFLRPYEFRELSARLDVMARRSVSVGEGSDAGMRLDLLPAEHAVLLNREKVRLSPREFAFIALLAARPGEVLTPPEILEAVWGEAHEPRPELVHAYASRLRAKLERGRPWRLLQAVRGHGYRLRIEPREESPPARAASK